MCCRWRPSTSVECWLLGDTENLGHPEKEGKGDRDNSEQRKSQLGVLSKKMKIQKTGRKKMMETKNPVVLDSKHGLCGCERRATPNLEFLGGTHNLELGP